MKTTPYLNFNGQCREAFELYARLLHARVDAIFTYGDMPNADEVPEGSRDAVMHAHLVGDGVELMGSDSPPGMYQQPAGTYVSIHITDVGRGEAIFNALAEGGAVQMPFEQTFWAERFGMVVDRFGTPWMINCEKQA